MRFIRYQHENRTPAYGWLDDEQVGGMQGTPFGDYQREEASLPLSSVRLLAPVEPGKIICVGRNYLEHARELGNEQPDIPLLFLKPPSSIIGTGQPIVLPPQSQKVEHEGELAVVIGQKGRWVAAEDALKLILGYTIANDVTARDLQRRDGQWTRGKGFDTFCPIGPWIETDFDPSDALLSTHVNQELRQMASTRDMVFSVRQLITFITSVMTLMPGDVILTGTPAGVGPLNAGDVVRVEIEGLGSLSNPVKAETHRA